MRDRRKREDEAAPSRPHIGTGTQVSSNLSRRRERAQPNWLTCVGTRSISIGHAGRQQAKKGTPSTHPIRGDELGAA